MSSPKIMRLLLYLPANSGHCPIESPPHNSRVFGKDVSESHFMLHPLVLNNVVMLCSVNIIAGGMLHGIGVDAAEILIFRSHGNEGSDSETIDKGVDKDGRDAARRRDEDDWFQILRGV